MKELVFSEEEIVESCTRIGKSLTEELKNEEYLPVFLGVMKGALNFFMDLVKRVEIPIFMDYIQVSSYSGTNSTGVIKLVKDINFNIKDRTVVIVEDIVDTGYSMQYLIEHVKSFGAKKVIVCTLFNKVCARKVDVQIDYCGKVLYENKFLAGYGLDYNELQRAIPYVYAVDQDELITLDKILAKNR